MLKPEFDPLLPAGFHEIELNDLEDIFAKNFIDNSRRVHLISQLRFFLEELSQVSAKFEIWLDGSFTTKKEKPGDIDILLLYNVMELNALSQLEKGMINSLFNRQATKIRYDIDILLCPDNDVDRKSYWRGWFGFSRNESPKGIARFKYGVN